MLRTHRPLKAAALVVLASSMLCADGCGPSRRDDTAGSEPRYRLVHKVPPGAYRTSITVTVHAKERKLAGGEKFEMDILFVGDIAVAAPTDQAPRLVTTTFERMTMRANNMSFDSDDFPTAEAVSHDPFQTAALQQWNMMRDLRVVQELESGNFVSIEGLPAGQELSEDLEKLVSGLRMKGNAGGGALDDISDILPTEPVGVGAIWHRSVTMDNEQFGRKTYEIECEFLRIDQADEPVAVLQFAGHIEGPMADKTITKIDLEVVGLVHLGLETGTVWTFEGHIGGNADAVENGETTKLKMKIPWVITFEKTG